MNLDLHLFRLAQGIGILAASGFVLTLLFTPIVRSLAVRAGWLDRPSHRKRHIVAVPRAGGIPILIAYAGSFGILLLLEIPAGRMLQESASTVLRVLPAVAVVFSVGLIDDIVGLGPFHKLLGQTAAAVLAYLGGVQICGIAYHPIEPYIGAPLTILLAACLHECI